jgi:hypothetical protein
MQDDRKTSLNLPKECDYIVSKALAGENTIVMMGCLMFLAYAGGDAFVLDLDDKYACPLCLDGQKQPYRLLDTGTTWAFEWPWSYDLAKGSVYFKRTDGEDSSGLPSMIAGALDREVKRYNRKAGTNFHL